MEQRAENLHTDSLDQSQNQLKKVDERFNTDQEAEGESSQIIHHIDQSLREYDNMSKQKIDYDNQTDIQEEQKMDNTYKRKQYRKYRKQGSISQGRPSFDYKNKNLSSMDRQQFVSSNDGPSTDINALENMFNEIMHETGSHQSIQQFNEEEDQKFNANNQRIFNQQTAETFNTAPQPVSVKTKNNIGQKLNKRVNNIDLQLVTDSDLSERDGKEETQEPNFPRNEDLESRPSEANLIKKIETPSYKKQSTKKRQHIILDKEQAAKNIDFDDKLSVQMLENHIRQNHPKKSNEEDWAITTDIGSLVDFGLRREIQPLLKDIGLGASLYLLTLKAYAYFFLFMTILNLPLYIIYSQGVEATTQHAGLIGQLTLGNIGEAGPNCNIIDLSKNKSDITLNCPSGTLKRIESVGLTSQKDQQCVKSEFNKKHTIYKYQDQYEYKEGLLNTQDAKYFETFVDFDQNCSTYTSEAFMNSSFIQNMVANFDKSCKNQQRCRIPYNYQDLSKDCLNEVVKRAQSSYNKDLYEAHLSYLVANNRQTFRISSYQHKIKTDELQPNLYILTYCDSQNIYMFGSKDMSISKFNVAVVIVFFDILGVLIFLFSYYLIFFMQKDFADSFDSQTVEARDFTVVIDQLPTNFKHYQNEYNMKFAIWHDIQEGLQLAKKMGMCSDKVDGTLININFGLRDNRIILHKKMIQEMTNELQLLHLEYARDKKISLLRTMDNKVQELTEELQRHRLFEVQNDKIQKHDDTDSDVYVERNDDPIFDSDYEEDEDAEDHKHYFYDEIIKVYITFKSMETKDLVQKLFGPVDLPGQNQGRIKSILYGLGFKKLSSSKSLFEMKLLKWKTIMASSSNVSFVRERNANSNRDQSGFDSLGLTKQKSSKSKGGDLSGSLNSFFDSKSKNEMIIRPACDPEFIIWKNIGTGSQERLFKRGISIASVLMIVGLTYLAIMSFKEYRQRTFSEILPVLGKKGIKGINCQSIQVPKKEAYFIQKLYKENKERSDKINGVTEGFRGKTTLTMFCFCQEQFYDNPLTFQELTFTEFDEDAEDYCGEFYKDFVYIQAMQGIPSVIIQVINVASTFLFIFMARFERQYTLTDENMSVFIMIFCQEFACVGIVQIYTESVREFNVYWYMQVGLGICFAMTLQIFSTKASELGHMLLDTILRLFDRGCVRKVLRENTDDEPNTKKLRQSDIQDLYTGPQMEAGEKFAQMFNAIFICMMYSAGLPLVYPICCLSFVVSYWFNKTMLMRYYQKTIEFNEELPINSMAYMKLAVAIHLIIAFIMLSNQKLLQSEATHERHFDVKYKLGDFEEESIWVTQTIILLVFSLILLVAALVDSFLLPFSDKLMEDLVDKIKAWVNRKALEKAEEMQKMKLEKVKTSRKVDNNSKVLKLKTISEARQARMQAEQENINKKNHAKQKKGIQQKQQIDEDHSDKSNNLSEIEDQEVQQTSQKETQGTQGKNEQPLRQNAMKADQLDEIQPDDDNQAIYSDNYYGEILFDFLEIFYQKALTTQSETREYMIKLKNKLNNNKIPKATYKKFKKYYESTELRRELIEKQIDYYYDNLAKITLKEEQQKINRANKHKNNEDQPAAPKSGYLTPTQQQLDIKGILPQIDPNDYLTKIRYLDETHDESHLQSVHFPKNFRCKSFVQSYNVLDSKEYLDVDKALIRAEAILSSDVMKKIQDQKNKQKAAQEADNIEMV